MDHRQHDIYCDEIGARNCKIQDGGAVTEEESRLRDVETIQGFQCSHWTAFRVAELFAQPAVFRSRLVRWHVINFHADKVNTLTSKVEN